MIFGLALAARVYQINIPFVEPYNSLSRQSIVATVARNFYQHGFNFFYPEIDENGKGPYLYNAEMPIYSYLMALGYKLAGGPHEWVARSVSAAFSMGAMLLLYFFVAYLYDRRLASLAAAFFAFSPLNLALSRAVQPEAPMLFGSIGCLYFFTLYQDTRRPKYYVFFLALLCFALATKLQSVYLAVPLFYLAWRGQGRRLFSDWRMYAALAAALLILGWYVRMFRLEGSGTLFYRPYRYYQNHVFDLQNFLQQFPKDLGRVGKYLALHILTPLGLAAFATGLFRADSSRNKVFYVWLAGYFVYLAIFWSFAVFHSYYHLPFIPVAALFTAKGLLWMWEKAQELKRPVVWLALAALACASLANALYFYGKTYYVPEKNRAIVKAGRAVQELTPADSLVVASYGGSPIQLYYCNRKGWLFDFTGDPEKAVAGFERFRREGAGYFVTTSLDALGQSAAVEAYLREKGKVVVENADFVIVDLGARK